MNGFQDAREERDSYLVVTSSVSAALNLLNGFRTWIPEECNELREIAEDIEPKLEGNLLETVRSAVRRMRDIEQYELPEASKALKDKISEISGGAYDNVMDARRYLDEGVYRFEGMVRDLLTYRRLLDALKGEFS